GRIGVDGGLDGGGRGGMIGAEKGSGGPKRRFTSGRPQREISHARRAFKAYVRPLPQPMGRGVEQSAKDTRAHCFKLAPKLALRTAALIGDWLQGEKDRSVSQI